MKNFVAGGLLLLLWLTGTALAAESPTWELGLRGGTDATGAIHSYNVAELYLLYPLPWQTEVGGGALRSRLDCGIAWLEAVGDSGGWLAVGADLVYALHTLPIELEIGFRPVWFPDDHFGRDDFGGPAQFASHAGIAVSLSPVVVSYRYQHLSNGGLYDENSGLDLHLFGIGARF